MDKLDNIVDLLNKDEVDAAIVAAESYISASKVPDDRAYYLLGNAYRKKGDWQQAINNYLQAIAINPDSPAQHAYDMAMDILNFFNKDMYNQ